MKLTSLVALGGLLLTTSAFADPILGQWQMIEDGKPKAIVTISKAGDSFTGVVTKGITDKAKGYVNTTVIKGLKAQDKGKYGQGIIVDPRDGKEYSMTATLNGQKLTIKGGYKVMGKVVGKTQVWKKVQ